MAEDFYPPPGTAINFNSIDMQTLQQNLNVAMVSADPEIVAVDLVGQAEHGYGYDETQRGVSACAKAPGKSAAPTNEQRTIAALQRARSEDHNHALQTVQRDSAAQNHGGTVAVQMQRRVRMRINLR